MAEEEVLEEVEAVQAVYEEDCTVLDKFPPNIHVHIKPRTADVSSQQFVEAVLAIKASPQYPVEPPHIDLIESKGLDDQRQQHLITTIRDKACELSSCLMLVTLCEEAVERLSIMNHPDGDCPLCLCPLVPEDRQDNVLPFMKLMSCFHCFHSECIIRWWNWLQTQEEASPSMSSNAPVHPSRNVENQQDMLGTMEESMGNCPVCRKAFQAKDFEHVLDLVGTHSSQLSLHGTEATDDDELLQSDSESIRRQKFESILKLQQENSGLIEPKKHLVVLPGMFLPQSIPSPNTMSIKETTEQQHRDPAVTLETNSTGSSDKSTTSERRYSGMRKTRGRNSRKQVTQWKKK
ncbi:hypothetical protein L1049_018584 [Liquidambar formosana]|uniref:RWD domain-containing protein n=1 Tax=Liquidambar formosana TaxID=63359 RepID=A0AAP0WMF5_LIQFO